MPLLKVYDNLERVLHREHSDDYDAFEDCLPTGQDYEVKIGDVVFLQEFARFDKQGFTVYVDGIRVMTYRYAQVFDRRYSDEPATATWHMDSPALREHVKRAAVEVDKRYRSAARMKERLDIEQRRQDDRKLESFKERFGITA